VYRPRKSFHTATESCMTGRYRVWPLVEEELLSSSLFTWRARKRKKRRSCGCSDRRGRCIAGRRCGHRNARSSSALCRVDGTSSVHEDRGVDSDMIQHRSSDVQPACGPAAHCHKYWWNCICYRRRSGVTCCWEHQGRVQQLTGRIGRTIGTAYVRQVSCWTTFILIQ